MNRNSYFIFFLAVLFAGIWSCDSPTDSKDDGKQVVVLKGQVINAETDTPVDSAVVRIRNYSPETTLLTDSEGKFSFEFETDQTFNIRVSVYKESFRSDSSTILVVPGRTISVPLFKLMPTAGTPVVSSEAAAIVLVSQSVPSIGVHESGSPETAELVFEVQDSSGIPVDLDHAVTVQFRLGSSPGGGEFLSPASGKTANNGRVSVNLFSGLIAGAVQIIAEVDLNGKTIRSLPVALAIHGGLPDSLHFSLAVEMLNFPGYNIFGLRDGITAYVGDKYGNPVRPETIVYYTTTGGIISGSAATNEFGEAGVDLISAEPRPNHPLLGPGFATVYARTADENLNMIEADAIVLFSGIAQLSVTPTSVYVPNGGSQTFNFTVRDQNNNPLAGGTKITVGVESGSVKAVGDVSLTLPDTQSRSWTNFSFTLMDAVPDSVMANQVSVKVSTSGPNGDVQMSVMGTAY